MSVSTVRASIGSTPYTVELEDNLGHRWLGDEPADVGGANAGPSPEHLLLGSLGTCTAVTLTMYARRKQWPLTGVRVELAVNPDGKPAAGTDIRRGIELLGELDDAQRERLLQIANACPIHKLLTGEIRIATALAAAS
ncbi:MAG: OsmC family peroxiredoxin [Lysobacteraceae bacterium]|nr:MAG: OsmC family peroxiredoxin [Xanthomonadaceae bacterium]